jgi:hypothetical protein
MSLDGLRAWIGEVERKLGVRTRVFLALTVIAIGIGGAAIYLAVDARDNSVSEGDVQALQEQLEARTGAGGGSPTGAEVVRLEAELKALRAEVAALGSEGGGSGNGTNGGSTGSGRDSGEEPSGGTRGESGGDADGGTTGGAASTPRLEELLEQAKEQSERNE